PASPPFPYTTLFRSARALHPRGARRFASRGGPGRLGGYAHPACRGAGAVGGGGLGRRRLRVRRFRVRGLRVLGLLRRRLALGAFGLRRSRGLLLLGAVQVALLLLVGLEVGLVPAASLETEHRRRHEFLQAALAARRTADERRIRDHLHDLHVELTGLAFVFVERH